MSGFSEAKHELSLQIGYFTNQAGLKGQPDNAVPQYLAGADVGSRAGPVYCE